jgi:hypothetical protein
MCKNLRLKALLICSLLLVSGCEMSTSTPEPCTPGASLPLSCMDVKLFIIEDGEVSLLTLGFMYEDQPVSPGSIDQVVCNDVEVPNSELLGYVVTMPYPIFDKEKIEIVYKCIISGNNHQATLFLFSNFRTKITSPTEGEWISPGKDFAISYDPGTWPAEWVRGEASLVVDGELKNHLQGENRTEQQNMYKLDISSFTPGTGRIWLARQITVDLPELFHVGVRSLNLVYSSVDMVNVFWK